MKLKHLDQENTIKLLKEFGLTVKEVYAFFNAYVEGKDELKIRPKEILNYLCNGEKDIKIMVYFAIIGLESAAEAILKGLEID